MKEELKEEPRIYHYKNGLATLSKEQVSGILKEIETKSRTGKFSYVEQNFFQSQSKDAQAEWPKPILEIARAKVKELSNGQAATLGFIRQALIHAAQSRLSKYEFEHFMGDMALATLYRRAPSLNTYPRKYAENGKKIRIRSLTRMVLAKSQIGLIVDCDDVDSADITVVAIHGAEQAAYLLGWASKADVSAAKTGNRYTDPDNCQWEKMAHCVPFSSLRPMAEMMAGMTEIPSGILFETVPALAELPIEAKDSIQVMTKAGEDYDEPWNEKIVQATN